MSKQDITSKIEHILNDILSRKYDAEITVKFVNTKETTSDDNCDTTRNIKE